MSPTKGLCPRCGLAISYYKERVHGRRRYTYAVHYVERDGRKVKEECYLGPRESYEYVSRPHEREGLILRGYTDSNSVLEYLDAIIDYVSNAELEPGIKREIAEKALKLLRSLNTEPTNI